MIAEWPPLQAMPPDVSKRTPSAEDWDELVHYAETLRALNDRLRASYEQLSSLVTLGQAMAAAGSRGRVGEILLATVREILPYRAAAVLLQEEAGFQRQCAADLTPDLESVLDRQVNEGILEQARNAAQPTLRAAPEVTEGPRAYVLLPLLYQGEFVGLLWLAMDEPAEDLTQEHLHTAGVLARQAAAAFRNAAYADLERSYQQLHALEAVKNDLMHMIVHDLRGPLTAIMANVEVAGMLSTEARPSEILSRALAGCETLVTLITNLLDVNNSEEGEMEVHRTRFPLLEALQPTIDARMPIAAQMNMPIVCEIAPDLPLLDADPDLMRRVFASLLGNALKHNRGGNPIQVVARWHPEQSEVFLSVTDRGPGIPEEHHERIFDKFGQMEVRQSSHRAGYGLGLTFCRMAVLAHGGRIWVESAAGQPTSFCFTLPVEV